MFKHREKKYISFFFCKLNILASFFFAFPLPFLVLLFFQSSSLDILNTAAGNRSPCSMVDPLGKGVEFI